MGPFRGVGWGRGGVGERGFCKGKEYHYLRPFNPPRGVLGPFGPKVGNGVENEFPGPSSPGVQKLEILSSTGAGVWRKAPKAFLDSSSVLDKFQSARTFFFE